MSQLTLVSGAVRASFLDSVKIILNLYKVMLPLIIGVKILSDLDLIKYAALPLEPLMKLMGLPTELGLAWAAGMIVNLYSGLIVFASIIPNIEPLSVAQASVFGLVCLFAHSLPVEGRISQQCGVSFLGQVILRIVVAISSGILLNLFLIKTGWLSQKAVIIFQVDNLDPTILAWVLSELKNFLYIFLIIMALLLLQRAIDYYNITKYLSIILRPLLRIFGLSDSAATTIMVGMSMGIIYGSGLIIKSANDGTLNKQDVFGVVTLVGLAHAIIEDTALLVLIGGNWFVILVLRTVIAIVAGAIISRTHRYYTQRVMT